MKNKLFLLLLLIILIQINGFSQIKNKKEKEPYIFNIVNEVASTPIKNQYRSGTCWTFASASFIESELLRLNKGKYDISEMFFVRMGYHNHAISYVRFHGNLNFSSGAEGWDVMNVVKQYGLVPEKAYLGLQYGETNHIHGELDNELKHFVDAVIENKNRKLSPIWLSAFDAILDTYLGSYPENFEYEGKLYTPIEFRNSLNFNPDDYIAITSFTHHPFYESFIFESPDNWSFGKIHNLPIDELIEVINYALKNNYTVAWAADVSEKGFSHRNGLALIPDTEIKIDADLEQAKWDNMSIIEKSKLIYSFDYYVNEKEITQDLRQKAYDNYETTDDHLMHIIALATDKKGNYFYKVKNSWGTEGSKYNGYFYASIPYVKYKTMSIMIHKDALPKDIAKKLGF